ncbi:MULTISPECIES: hypothetical protein [unclassified Bradyrhizobium]|uniref:hypothetical protein n=1 Tax=unclassified Bradyrhizobium TaxID=2631580 RepID=UPI0029163561|nr:MULTISPECIES: hypothetical protein [unclassified Bradyrhizobium]
MKSTAYLISALCMFASAEHAHADSATIVDPAIRGSSGLSIFRDAVPEEGDFSDATYKAFKNFRKDTLYSEDYYYQLRLVPQYKTTFSNCNREPGIVKFFQRLFGTSEAALVLLKASISYRYASGQSVAYAQDASPATLFMLGKGTDPGTMNPGNGCFLDVTNSPTYPLFRYSGGGSQQDYDDFSLRFIIQGGEVVRSNLLSNIYKFFDRVSAAASFVPLGSAAAKAVSDSSKDMDDAVSNALGRDDRFTVGPVYIKQGDRLRIRVPDLIGNSGSIVLYPRKYGSIALDTNDPEINAAHVLGRSELASRGCDAPKVVSNDCSKSTTIRDTIRSADSVKSVNNNLPASIFQPNDPEQHKYAYNLCIEIKKFLRENLRLSTLDEMMVRWAILVDSQMMNALFDARVNAIAQASGTTVDGLRTVCWNKGDDETVRGVVTKALKKRLTFNSY